MDGKPWRLWQWRRAAAGQIGCWARRPSAAGKVAVKGAAPFPSKEAHKEEGTAGGAAAVLQAHIKALKIARRSHAGQRRSTLVKAWAIAGQGMGDCAPVNSFPPLHVLGTQGGHGRMRPSGFGAKVAALAARGEKHARTARRARGSPCPPQEASAHRLRERAPIAPPREERAPWPCEAKHACGSALPRRGGHLVSRSLSGRSLPPEARPPAAPW